ncbi:hypothetical protein [Imtechella halotolerans]|uniref:Uncharacterized protein n=1 Tax=Imtechella halotolerans K1 TaxID=946077 RepID=I0W7G6_9FLAO|nr:hypothetical protein [Imtechella halotolerans]EID72332.1 hypothetical protein W5A_12531 [Imtechella halotolerans K1]WMQ64434.1 hypothetical protein PT603_05495 [Imtechella halotolerans]
MNNIMINVGIVSRLVFLLLPLVGITLWFIYDGGIGFGWNLIWYWISIIGFLLLYQLALLLNLMLQHKKKGFSKENKIFIIIGLILLFLAIVIFSNKL